MAYPTVGEVLDEALSRLGDEETGEMFGADSLLRHFGVAYRRLIKALDISNVTLIHRRAYFVLPANTAVWVPSQSGVDDFGSPQQDGVRTANISSQHTVIGVTVASDYVDVQFSASHGLVAGTQIVLYGVTGLEADRINDFWTITSVPGADTVRINGCVEAGTYTSGGTAVVPSGDFGYPLEQLHNPRDVSRSGLGTYCWTGGQMRFSSYSSDVLIEAAYVLSGVPPKRPRQTIYIDDSLDFLAAFTGYQAAKANGASGKAQELLFDAVGSDNEADATGGYLGEILGSAIQQLNSTVYQAGRFRERRPRWAINS